MDPSFDQLPKSWSKATIGDLIDADGIFIDGDWIETKDQNPSGDVRLIQLADIGDGVFRNKSNRYLTHQKAVELGCTFLQPGDVLIARMPDPLGRACIFPGDTKPAITAVDICVVRTGISGVNNRWLMNAVNSVEIRSLIASLQSGSTRKRISRSNLAKIEFPVPPLAEQQRIVAKVEELFTQLDDGVQELQKAQAQLKRYRQAVLQAAVTGELTREWREAHKDGLEPASVLLARILKEHRERWEADQIAKMVASDKSPSTDDWKNKYQEPTAPDTEHLPTLPSGWMWSSFGQTFRVYVGATPSRKKSTYWNGQFPWVSSSEVAFCRIKSTRETITELGLQNSSTYLHPAGTVLLGMIGEGKTRGQAAILDISACNSQNSAAIRVSEAGIRPEYIYYYLQGEYDRTRKLGSGNNQPALNKSRVQGMIFSLPPLGEQNEIAQKLDWLFSIADAIQHSIEIELIQAERLRQSTLKQAFEGRLVPQDPNDEPAEQLLERIKTERAKREAEKQAEAKSNRKRSPKKHPKRTERPAA